MRINWWSGRQVLDGYYNVDAALHPKAPRPPELMHATEFAPDGSVLNPLPLPDGCATELLACHVVEHVTEWQAPFLVAEWHRLLAPGGTLILELPNLEAAARNLLAGRSKQMTMFAFYGDGSHKDPYMLHRYAYTPASIVELVTAAGFIKARVLPPQTHGARHDRDMRVEARKPAC